MAEMMVDSEWSSIVMLLLLVKNLIDGSGLIMHVAECSSLFTAFMQNFNAL